MPGADGIDTVDVVAIQEHVLGLVSLTGCSLLAGDVNGSSTINTVDVTAVNRFFLGYTNGIANVGKYGFNPPSRSYSGISNDATGQDYTAIVFGDVTSRYVHRPTDETADPVHPSSTKRPAAINAVLSPDVRSNQPKENFTDLNLNTQRPGTAR